MIMIAASAALGAISYLGARACPQVPWNLVSAALAIGSGLVWSWSASLPEGSQHLSQLLSWAAATLAVMSAVVLLP
jgi:hypothetical protein